MTLPDTAPADWWHQAACRGCNPNLWFPGRGEDVGPAKTICARCPVRAACLEHSVTRRESTGVWGGLSSRSRRRIWQSRDRLELEEAS